MRLQLKGVHKTSKKLADGTMRHYYYAWKGKGAPLLEGEYGSKEFIASYLEAVKAQRVSPYDKSKLGHIIRKYEASQKFANLAARTREDYKRLLTQIDKDFSKFPLNAAANPNTLGVIYNWHAKLAKKSARQADYHLAVLSILFEFAMKQGLATHNPCLSIEKVYKGNRKNITWQYEDEAAFLRAAPKHLHLPFMLGLYTAQRQGDLLSLTWAAYDGEYIRLKQGKTKQRVAIKVLSILKPYLDDAKKRNKRGLYICETTDNKKWTSDGFSASWRKALVKAGITGLTFHDLRGSAITRFYNGGMKVEEIAAISGHALSEIKAALEQSYLGDRAEADTRSMDKFEEHLRTKAPN